MGFTEISRRSAAAYYHLGVDAQEKREFSRASELYRKALKIFLRDDKKRELAETYHQLGNVAYQQQQW